MPGSEKFGRRWIIGAVAAATRISAGELTSAARKPPVVRARWIAMWLMRREGLSMPQIGRALGDRDHTTVRHGLLGFEAAMADGKDIELMMLRDRALALLRQRQAMCNDRRASWPDWLEVAPVEDASSYVTAPKPTPPPRPPLRVPTWIAPPWMARARTLRRQGWTMAGIARYFSASEEEVRRVLGEQAERVPA